MSGAVWINGEFVERDSARVSVFDAGFQHGVGLFETMLAVGGEIAHVRRHMRRLKNSAAELGLTSALNVDPLIQAAEMVARESGLPRARVRLTLTGGDLNMLASTGQGPVNPTIVIVANPATEYPSEMIEKGVTAVVADLRVNPLDPGEGHKTLNYWPRLRSLQQAAAKGAGESIIFQVSNHLAGGAVSNIFLVKDGVLLTPIARGEEEQAALPSPVLPGITRRFILEEAEAAGVECVKKMLSIDDLLGADEVFLTNSSWGALPVVRVEAEQIADGAPGALTKSLYVKWRAGAGLD